MNKDKCKGCSVYCDDEYVEEYWECIFDPDDIPNLSIDCPCITCLIKMKCSDWCEKFEKYQKIELSKWRSSGYKRKWKTKDM